MGEKHPNMLMSADPSWFDALEAQYQRDPASVPEEWRALIEGRPLPAPAIEGSSAAGLDGRIAGLVEAYRARGYLVADYDPLGLAQKPTVADLDPAYHGIGPHDLSSPVDMAPSFRNGGAPTLAALIDHLKASYCGTLSADFTHLEDAARRRWLQERLEDAAARRPAPERRRRILDKLVEAESFENFLQLKFPTAKRFGLEGAEAQLPMYERLLERAAAAEVEEVVIGPHHRGRTTLMPTLMGKPLAAVIAEFAGQPPFPEELDNAGDVSYHMGWSGIREIGGRTLKLSMASHPSHVEVINAVSLGKLRAKQALADDPARLLGLMIHTDGGIAGQGVVYETLQLSQIAGYGTGGSIHVTVDNQVAFTTRPEDARSSRFASDVMKTIGAPVLRVNADDPEAAVRAADIAFDYQQTFGADVMIELICYRRRGHNEMDEPRYTQPGMYQRVDALEPVRKRYQDRLAAEGALDTDLADAMAAPHLARFEDGFSGAETWRPNAPEWRAGRWAGICTRAESETGDAPETGVDAGRLTDLGRRLRSVPEGFTLHPKIARQLEERQEALEAGSGIVWAAAEELAFASLLDEGCAVRLTGEDTRRGTFSQRHGDLRDQATDKAWAPLGSVNPDARFEIYDTPLSEEAVLAFEYGYSTADPNTLVCWEAQFGDFANGAQIVIDQFIASGEEKWFRLSGLVLLLPHGLEAGGPEHSSARLERFLQLCAKDNLQVAYPSTPANYFHLLRRQMVRDFRTPLVVMTPKSLLRHRRAVSDLADLDAGTRFQPVIGDAPENGPRRHILCSGRVYYDLLEAREAAGQTDTAITRIEELYPLAEDDLAAELARHGDADLVWCQEEPENMGAWHYIERQLRRLTDRSVRYVGRPASPSPAVGYPARHKAAQAAVVEEALS